MSLKIIALTSIFVASLSGTFIEPSWAFSQEAEELLIHGNIAEAEKFLEEAIRKNDRRALYVFGVTYLFSEDRNVRDEVKGLTLVKKSAYQGYGPAYNALGDYYLEHGQDKEAFKNYYRSAEFGFGPGQFNTGILYRNGQGIERNAAKAYLYLSLASLNENDLDNVRHNAAIYRDLLVSELTPRERQEALKLLVDATPSDPE